MSSPTITSADAGPNPSLQQRWYNLKRDVTASICPPPTNVRLVVLRVSRSHLGDVRHEAIPVVAMKSVINQLWSASRYGCEGAPREYGTPEQLAKRGWQLDGQHAEADVLFVEPHGGYLVSLSESRPHDAAERLVACTWAEHEDGERLKPFVRELERFLPPQEES